MCSLEKLIFDLLFFFFQRNVVQKRNFVTTSLSSSPSLESLQLSLSPPWIDKNRTKWNPLWMLFPKCYKARTNVSLTETLLAIASKCWSAIFTIQPLFLSFPAALKFKYEEPLNGRLFKDIHKKFCYVSAQHVHNCHVKIVS